MEDGKEIYIVKKGRQITAEWRMERRFILLKKEGRSQLKVKGKEFIYIYIYIYIYVKWRLIDLEEENFTTSVRRCLKLCIDRGTTCKVGEILFYISTMAAKGGKDIIGDSRHHHVQAVMESRKQEDTTTFSPWNDYPKILSSSLPICFRSLFLSVSWGYLLLYMYSLPYPRLSRPLRPYLLSYFSVSNRFAQREWWSPCAWAVHSDNNLVELGNETIKEDDRLFYWNEVLQNQHLQSSIFHPSK